MNALVMYQHASRRSSPRHDAEGQATTEFLVALSLPALAAATVGTTIL